MQTLLRKNDKAFQWKRLLILGNTCFEEQDFCKAEYYYKEAESQLDIMWSLQRLNTDLLMAWICSLHNLSSLFIERGDKEIALKYLLIPHQRMLHLSKEGNSEEELQLVALNALNITLPPILAFTKDNPICKSCLQSIQAFEQHQPMQYASLH